MFPTVNGVALHTAFHYHPPPRSPDITEIVVWWTKTIVIYPSIFLHFVNPQGPHSASFSLYAFSPLPISICCESFSHSVLINDRLQNIVDYDRSISVSNKKQLIWVFIE